MIEIVGEGIWKCAGPKNGPTIVLFGGTHGNELTGIEVVKKMLREIESEQMTIESGILYLILGNPRAIERNTRGSEDHADLNRCFKKDVLHSVTPPLNEGEGMGGVETVYENERAKEIAKILVNADVSIDLHATNKPSVPFLCCLADKNHEQVYRWFDCDRVLADPRYILAGEPVTTDEYMDVQGGVGVCYETGFVGDLTRVEAVYGNVLNVLRDQKMLIDQGFAETQFENKHVFELTQRINLTEAGFRYADGRGKGSFEEFKEGDVLGYVDEDPFVAQYDGVIIFPKVPEHWKIGQPVMFLGKMV
jgi:succinylglutamate desuccinylase